MKQYTLICLCMSGLQKYDTFALPHMIYRILLSFNQLYALANQKYHL